MTILSKSCKEVKEQTDLWDREKLRRELKEFGAWDQEELADDDRNVIRMVWCAACDLKEEETNDE